MGHGDDATTARAPTGACSDGHAERLTSYYEDTWFEYRLLWLDSSTRAMHFGYEQPGTTSHAESLLALNHVMAEHVDLRPGERVLDAGCGVGGTSMWLSEAYGAEVVGVNLVDEHVERARRYVRQRNLGARVKFVRADYTATGLPDASFDVVWAQESACHARDKGALAREAARVLRPGGRLVMAEYLATPGHDDPDMAEWDEAWEMRVVSADHWRQALTDAGLVDVAIDDITPKMVRSLRRLDRYCRALLPIAKGLHRLGLRTEVQQRNITGSRAMVRALDRGSWRYGIVTARRPG